MNTQTQSLQNTTSALNALSISPLLKAAADPLRLDILRALATDSYGVTELCHLFQIKQSSMSHHLKVLATAGLVATRREGNSIFYLRNHADQQDQLAPLQTTLHETIDKIPLQADLNVRITDVHQQRAHASQHFFAEHIGEFKEKQDLIAAYDVYADQVVELLRSSPIPAYENALEIGPGEGIFLRELATRFQQVAALDNSEAMLRAAQQFADSKNLQNIHFHHNDSRFCTSTGPIFDCAVINMVLHHTPSPAQMFADVSTALKPNAVLLVCDLCHHDQDWARDACGDIWLGFDPQDLGRWATDSGFLEGQSVYFALRNGFQIQIRQFIKEQH
ncbi:ArsR/SmtB family transcription factor [Teredinibacter purpureus]|uniref:ArsR/SmtB family transcription factor n=1 Tax=Teredinibacter purpureus TaxID=2731756 RepID=UPI0005F85514|nr:metalloregulator ArsR/SmtB family transcription factor [Teredinibacter purpureus]